MTHRSSLGSLILLTAACGGSEGRVPATCGLAAVARTDRVAGAVQRPQSHPGRTAATLPERLVARVVADGAFPAVVGRTDSLLVIGVEGNLPSTAKPGFGVLVVDTSERAHGVMLYEGNPVHGAPQIGEVYVGGSRCR